MSNVLRPYLAAVRSTLTAALTLENFSSQVVERHNKPEVEVGGSKEVLLNPLIISRNENERVLIEPSVNSIRLSIKIKQADEIERILCHKFTRFMMQRAENFIVLRRKPVKGYDISFLITNFQTETMLKHKIVDFIIQFMEDVDREISEMKLSLNARARIVAESYLLADSRVTMSDPDFQMGTPRKNLVYDPNQDPEEKRAIRRGYYDLRKGSDGAPLNINDYTAQQLVDKVQRADSLFHRVAAPQEATLDSAFLVLASNMGATKARAMKSGSGAFDMDDFISKLITFMGGRRGEQLSDDSDMEDGDADIPLDWEKIGRKALAKSRRVPAMDFMLGPLAIEQKKRNIGKRAKLEKNKEDERKPQELKEDDIIRSENETTKNVIAIKELLEEQGEVNLFKFVVNPNDFAQSVENIFHLSFLIRDGVCAMEIKPDGEPIIFVCEAPGDGDYEEGLKKQQMIMSFDMQAWQRAIEVFDIQEPIIPQRPKQHEQKSDGRKWVF
ncbi:hypothetical protein EW146_g1321 [Bondarzewia mesenterica]|uniref:Arp2/3 complex 20 kDa n=1 Tax=Bondarzewia mesenterica TaxID=1095465 RepID=A0A4S4M6J1_9AGAM|nr:hypothetical protein EW146_g1321 [Bondarzewia mesenterica]